MVKDKLLNPWHPLPGPDPTTLFLRCILQTKRQQDYNSSINERGSRIRVAHANPLVCATQNFTHSQKCIKVYIALLPTATSSKKTKTPRGLYTTQVQFNAGRLEGAKTPAGLRGGCPLHRYFTVGRARSWTVGVCFDWSAASDGTPAVRARSALKGRQKDKGTAHKAEARRVHRGERSLFTPLNQCACKGTVRRWMDRSHMARLTNMGWKRPFESY